MTDVWAEVARTLQSMAADDRFSGSVLVRQGDEALLECGAGLADRSSGTPITPRTRFALASLSKPFTAMTVLSCVRAGMLDLDARVADVLPAARRPRTMSARVTVHQLLTHTSGIGDYAEEDEDVPGHVEDYGSLWHDLPTYRMERPDDYLPLYADTAPVAEPGGAFHYSNAGYVLLGALLEHLTGLEFVEAVAEHVLGPAGMVDSGYFRLDDAVRDLAVGYLPGPDGRISGRSNVFSVPVIGGGDGGAFATPRDLDRFLRAIADDSLLGPELSTLVRNPQVPVAEGYQMACGLFVRDAGGFGHGGGDPGVETLARLVPERDLSMVVLCNCEGGLDPAWQLLEQALGGS